MLEWLIVCHEVARTYGLLVGGIVALAIAAWRSWTASRSLDLERYKTGAELLDGKNHGHTARIAGAIVLSELGENNKQRHKQAMIAFQAFLAHPPRFSRRHGHHEEDSVDYESYDILETQRIVNNRSRIQKTWHTFELYSDAPFSVNRDGTVKPNVDSEEFKKWVRATGYPPPDML